MASLVKFKSATTNNRAVKGLSKLVIDTRLSLTGRAAVGIFLEYNRASEGLRAT